MMSLKKPLVLMLVFALTSLQAGAVEFFENAVRSDMRAADPIAAGIVRLNIGDNICTGFFVKNRDQKFYLATARHCAGYAFEQACAAGKIRVRTQSGGHLGLCRSIVASDTVYDAVVFEAAFLAAPDVVLASINFLQLSRERVSLGTKLVTYGHPADRIRNAAPTITSNCWANNGIEAGGFLGEQRVSNLVVDPLAAQEHARLQKITSDIRMHENHIAYNCTVYGGNSGGPVLKFGTNEVVGMPAMYRPDRYEVLPKTAASNFFTLDNFIDANAPALREAGVLWD